MHRTPRPILLALGAAAVLLAACDPGHQVGEMADQPGTVTVPDVAASEVEEQQVEADFEIEDQTSDGASILVERVDFEAGRGWLAVYTIEADAPAALVGYEQAPAKVDDVTIDLEQPLEPGEHELILMAHTDAEPVGQFQWPGEDVPVSDAAGDTLERRFTVTVEP